MLPPADRPEKSATSRRPRVVSLTCSNTEIVAALGCAGCLVGVDDYSDYPPEVVASLARVGPDLGIDVARVSALEPDLVLASLTVPGHEKVVEAIDRAGLPYVAPGPESLEDVFESVRDIAIRLGVERAGEALVDSMREGLEPVSPAGGTARPTIAVQWWPKPPILAGGSSWVDELIERAGGRNLLHGEAVLSRPLSFEEFALADPDAIVIAWCGVDETKVRPESLSSREELRSMRAVRDHAVTMISESVLGRPGPRLVDGYRSLVRLVDELSASR